MRAVTELFRWRARVLAGAVCVGLTCLETKAAVTVLGVQYQQDNPYSEYNCWYHFGNYPTSCGTSITGANAHVFLKNTGTSSVTINDVTLAGYSLKTILKRDAALHDSASIYYYWQDPPADIFNAGEPVWYRADPNPIPAGGVAQVVVRLRSVPVTKPISMGVVTSVGTVTTNVPVNASDPVLASVGFSTNRTKVYLHWRRPGGGAAPASVWLDGTNVTSLTTTVGDSTMDFAVSVIELASPLPNMSYHAFQGVYEDDKMASGSLRVWVNRFLYGTWGVREIPDNDTAAAQAWINECQQRGVNVYVNNSSGGLQDFMATVAGRDYAEAHDYGYVKDSNTWGTNPRMWFIDDEPDIEEGNVACGTGYRVPCGGGHLTGILGLTMLERGEALRAINPSAPTTINLDGNFKPDGWYAYGQLADVMMMDSYYEGEQSGAYWDRPNAIPVFYKATSIYAAAIATTTAAEPNPMHMILNSVEHKNMDTGEIWPFASPANKRIQAYYALAGGAKGVAYWWFKSGYPYNGLAAGTPAALALWKEIGLIGNEIKTAQPLLVVSHPVSMPLSPSANVWARALASGLDTILLIVVNDNYLNDETGTHLTNVPNATVSVTLPSWMQSHATAFEISCGGLKPVNTQANGNQLQFNLGTLTVTRMILLSKDPLLLSTLQQRFDTICRPGICAFAPEYCVNVPLSIAQQPANLVLSPGGAGSFAVAAYGTGLQYQWQKNLSNLSDGGHYSGCNGAVLTVTGVNSGDEGSYRCVITTAYATTNTVAATLSLTTDPPAVPAVNSASGVSSDRFTANWSSANGAVGYRLDVSTNSGFGTFLNGYQDTDVGNSLSWTVSGLTSGGTYYYRVRAYNGNGSSGNSGTMNVTLPVPVTCPAVGLVNADFEGGNIGGVATGWTGYQRAPNPTTVWTIQTASPPSGGGLQYQQIANTTSTGGGGVRQNITGCVIGATYTISGWMRGNSGLYSTCRVKVSPTASTDWATAIDLNPPQVYTGDTWTPFSGTVVATGTSMTLWLDGETGGTALNKAECFDSITVTCEITSIPPTLTQQPTSQSVAPGGSASFTVQAYGSEPFAYQWQKNSTDLADGGHYSGVNTATLFVTGADSNDVATYRCVVTNAFGSTTSVPATLTVTAVTMPPSITEQPSNQSVGTGGNTSFTILAGGDNPLSYQWQKNSVKLANGGHYSGVTTAALAISGADSNDAASYCCVVTNAYGSATSSIATLTVTNVTLPPSITQQPSNQSVAAGGSASFTVVADGDSPLSYQWQKNAAQLADGGHYSGTTTFTLTISNADSADAASYRCIVTNAHGSATSSPAILVVLTNLPLLTNIPTLSGDTTNDARAITPDGRWVVGISGVRGFLYDRLTGDLVNVLSSDGAQSSILSGVGYRTNSGQQEIVVSGLSDGWFTAWMTPDGGATWGAQLQYASGKQPTVPLANAVAGTASDVCYAIWTDKGTNFNDNWSLNLGRFSNSWPATVAWGPKSIPKPDLAQVNGIASKGRAVGWRQNGSTMIYANYVADWQGATTPAMWNFNGLDGTTAGQATAVSADGTIIFGLSPKGASTGSTNFGYKAVFDASFPGTATQLSIGQLPNFTNAAGTTALAVPYGCTADGQYAVGMNYRGMEKAVLWNASDGSATNWTVTDLTDLAIANGGPDIFSRLTRAYSVGTNATGDLVIAGVGLDTNSPAKTRAFVMTVALSNSPVITRPTVTISGSYAAGFTFSFPTVASATVVYYLEYATNLSAAMTWNLVASMPGSGAVASLSDSNATGQRRFYRVRIQ